MSSLPLPRARQVFSCPDFDRQYYEFYYHKLLEQLPPGGAGATELGDPQPSIEAYSDPSHTGAENAAEWAADELRSDQVNDRIRTAQETNRWGSIPGRHKEHILALLRPKLTSIACPGDSWLMIEVR